MAAAQMSPAQASAIVQAPVTPVNITPKETVELGRTGMCGCSLLISPLVSSTVMCGVWDGGESLLASVCMQDCRSPRSA